MDGLEETIGPLTLHDKLAALFPEDQDAQLRDARVELTVLIDTLKVSSFLYTDQIW
jgi:hypothetical protein